MASAGMAQCLSDTCGVVFGGAVLGAVSRLGFDEPALTRAQRSMRIFQARQPAHRMALPSQKESLRKRCTLFARPEGLAQKAGLRRRTTVHFLRSA